MILVINESGRNVLGQIIGQFKSGVTREVRKTMPNAQIWQRSFHDHVIRNKKQYEQIWMYIESNPVKWQDDCFFTENVQQ